MRVFSVARVAAIFSMEPISTRRTDAQTERLPIYAGVFKVFLAAPTLAPETDTHTRTHTYTHSADIQRANRTRSFRRALALSTYTATAAVAAATTTAFSQVKANTMHARHTDRFCRLLVCTQTKRD